MNEDDDFIVRNWGLLAPNLRELCRAVGICPNNEKEGLKQV